MEHYYREFFYESIPPATAAAEEVFRATLKMVVWCGFYLEALVNHHFPIILGVLVSKHEVARELWKSLERKELYDKYILLGKLAGRPQFALQTVEKRVRFVAGLRNRLAHYKDAPTPIGKEIVWEDSKLMGVFIDEVLDHAPLTEVESLLNVGTAETLQRYLTGLTQWLHVITYRKQVTGAE